MKKLIIPILLIVVVITLSACSVSKKPLVAYTDIVGTWEKNDGVNKGMQVKVEKQGDSYKSSIVKVDKKTDVANYNVGDEKWADITKSNDTLWKMKDLAPIMNNKTVRYDTNIKMANKGNAIELNQTNKKGEEIGSTDVWLRVN